MRARRARRRARAARLGAQRAACLTDAGWFFSPRSEIVVGGRLGLRVGASELRRRDALRTRDDLAAARLALVEKNRELLDAQDYEVRLATLAGAGPHRA